MDIIEFFLKHLFNATVRKNSSCPDGYEHQMPDGSWMCGREHEEAYNFTEEEIAETFKEYKDSVNMGYSELKDWSETKCSKKASLGRDAVNRNLKLLSKKKADWIEGQIKKGYDDVLFFDDSIKNINAVKALKKK